MILTLLKGAGQVFCRMYLSLALSDIFSWITQGYGFGGGSSQMWCPLLVTSYQWYMLSICFITGDVNLDHVVKVVSCLVSPSIVNYYFFFTPYILCKQVTKSSLFSRKGNLSPASWREEGQRICGHVLKPPQEIVFRRRHVEPTQISCFSSEFRLLISALIGGFLPATTIDIVL